MEAEEMKIKLDEGAYMPTRAHDTDAGLDIRSPVRRVVWSRSREVIDTGVHVEIPAGYVGMLKSRSGLMCKHGITSEGTIDAGYTGSIAVCLINTSDEPYTVEAGDKISQLVVVPCLIEEPELVDEIASGDRGEKGFGSTGR
jgi:dUTP pyrophosphatase